jgi:hypothetical protein
LSGVSTDGGLLITVEDNILPTTQRRFKRLSIPIAFPRPDLRILFEPIEPVESTWGLKTKD